jgi:hypothetical protein
MPDTTKPFAFNLKFSLLFIAVFITEILIAMYVHDSIIRPFGGDVLVVVLIYAFVRSFLNTNYFYTAIGVLVFSFAVEISQAFNLVKMLGLQHNKIMRIALGSTFSYYDLLAYFIGFFICLKIEPRVAGLKMD